MKIRNIFFMSSISVLLFSCEGSTGDYETTESGLVYRFYNKNEAGLKAQEGDLLQLDVNFRSDKDSLVFDSKKNSPDGSGTINYLLRPSEFNGSFEEAVSMMSVGDSASFKINADSFYLKTFKAPALPPNITSGSMLTFEVKLVNIKNKETLLKEEEERRNKQMEIMAKRKEVEPQEIAAYIAANKITAKPTESGLYYIEVKKGTGEKIVTGKTVQVKYTGKFLDGRIFDTSEGKPRPFEFQVGTPGIIPGWEEAILKMNVGGKAMLLIPSSLGYGETGIGEGLIPPYTPLVFDVEVISAK